MIGGVAGFARKGSVPSLIGGVGYVVCPQVVLYPTGPDEFGSVGGLYIWSAFALRDGQPFGVEGALGMWTQGINPIHCFA